MDKECKTCQQQNPRHANFCRRCGRRLDVPGWCWSEGRWERRWRGEDTWLFLMFGPLAWLFPRFRCPQD